MRLVEIERTLNKGTFFQQLVNDYIALCTINMIHLESGAIDGNTKQELIKMMRQIREPYFDGKSLWDLPTLAINKNKNKILHHIHDMIKYIVPRLKKYLKPEEYQKRENRINKIVQLYKNAVDEALMSN